MAEKKSKELWKDMVECRGAVCITPDGRIIINVDKSECGEEFAEQLVKRIIAGQGTEYKLVTDSKTTVPKKEKA